MLSTGRSRPVVRHITGVNFISTAGSDLSSEQSSSFGDSILQPSERSTTGALGPLSESHFQPGRQLRRPLTPELRRNEFISQA